jgi:hypothetical protein
MNKILLIAIAMIAVHAQANEPTQVVRGKVAEVKFRACMQADEFGVYAHTVQKRGGQYIDYISTVDGQDIVGDPTQSSSNLARAVGRYIFLEHGKERVFDVCMRYPALFRINL